MNAALGRRRRQRRRQGADDRKVPVAEIKRLVGLELDKRHNQADLGPDGAHFLEMHCDPLGQSRKGPKSFSAALPDGHPGHFVVMTCAVQKAFSGATATTGVVTLTPPNGTDCGGLRIGYGNDPLVPAQSPTAHSDSLFPEATIANAIRGTNKIRIIASAIRVISVDANDDNDGFLMAGLSHIGIRAGAGYNTYGDIVANKSSSYTFAQGIVVRQRLEPENLTFHAQDVSALTSPWLNGNFPIVVFSQLSATANMWVEATMTYEVLVSDEEVSPFVPPVRGFEDELSHLVHYANHEPWHTEGNSFKSFIKGLFSRAKKVFNFVRRVGPHAIRFGTHLAAAL